MSPRAASGTPTSRDRRYGTRRWRRIAKLVIARDHGICRVVPGCPTRATAADHILAVYVGMPDSLFFGAGNLRAACRDHNLARGHVAKLSPPIADSGSGAVVTRNYTRELADAG